MKLLGFDIATQQQFQVGQMDGWLDGWSLSRQSDVPMMEWMDMSHHDSSMTMPSMPTTQPGALMPGMATPAEMTKLQGLSG